MIQNSLHGTQCTVSVVIKTLNEARNIAGTVESALDALKTVGGEVIVADSHSTDETIAIASHYPVRIVRLKNPWERRCGVGPQLGFQHAHGRYIYILDGDMRLHSEFLVRALAFMDNNLDVAGVGGKVLEKNTSSLEFLARTERDHEHMRTGLVDRLCMGGLYRRSAVESVGYFSDRNLHSYEELDLALRLTKAGWKLQRLSAPAVDHYGHDISEYKLLRKRWTSQYSDGLGELLRAAKGTGRLAATWASVAEARIYIGFAVLTAGMLICAGLGVLFGLWQIVFGSFATMILPWALMVCRKRSLAKANYSLASWSINAVALVRGCLRNRVDPMTRIASEIVR